MNALGGGKISFAVDRSFRALVNPARIRPICSGVSGLMPALLFNGGIQESWSVSVWATALMIKLLALSPGVRILPSLVPLSTPSRVSMCSRALGLSPLWHFTQEASKIGFMSVA